MVHLKHSVRGPIQPLHQRPQSAGCAIRRSRPEPQPRPKRRVEVSLPVLGNNPRGLCDFHIEEDTLRNSSIIFLTRIRLVTQLYISAHVGNPFWAPSLTVYSIRYLSTVNHKDNPKRYKFATDIPTNIVHGGTTHNDSSRGCSPRNSRNITSIVRMCDGIWNHPLILR